MDGFNLPDDWDEERYEKRFGTRRVLCNSDCEYYRYLEDDDREVELCVIDDVDFIPKEGWCEQ